MLVKVSERYQNTPIAKDAAIIMRKCVHRGFCNGTCPTFIQTKQQELGPRGRLYLIKALLEGKPLTTLQRKQLDLCLVCRSCETTCPASIQFGKLMQSTKQLLEQEYPRPLFERLKRAALRQTLPYRHRMRVIATLGRACRPLLSAKHQKQLSLAQRTREPSAKKQSRKVVLLQGCTQSALTPNINSATKRILSRLDLEIIEVKKEGCCGAIEINLGNKDSALDTMRRNIDAWLPYIDSGAEAIISNASSCALTVSEYSSHLKDDPVYAVKAQKISRCFYELGSWLNQQNLSSFPSVTIKQKIAVHSPCSLRHGLKQREMPDELLKKLGFELVETHDRNICCGSGGTYSLLQTEMSQQLLVNKLEGLTANNPDAIVTSNSSCLLHLTTKASIPIKHWIEMVDESI